MNPYEIVIFAGLAVNAVIIIMLAHSAIRWQRKAEAYARKYGPLVVLLAMWVGAANGANYTWGGGTLNWSDTTNATGWGISGGTSPAGTYPGQSGTTDTFLISSGSVTLNVTGCSLSSGTVGGTGMILQPSGTTGLTFTSTSTPCFTFTGTSTNGAFRFTGGSTNWNCTSGTLLNNTGSGRAFSHTSGGSVVITNPNGLVISNADGSNGYCYTHGGGTTTINGGVYSGNGNGRGIYSSGGYLFYNPIGNTLAVANGANSGIYLAGSNATITGLLVTSNSTAFNGPIIISAGTLSLAYSSPMSSTSAMELWVNGGTLNLGGLAITNSGSIIIENHFGGTITGTPNITLATPSAQFAVIGGTSPSGTGTLAGITPYLAPGTMSLTGSDTLSSKYFVVAGGTVNGSATKGTTLLVTGTGSTSGTLTSGTTSLVVSTGTVNLSGGTVNVPVAAAVSSGTLTGLANTSGSVGTAPVGGGRNAIRTGGMMGAIPLLAAMSPALEQIGINVLSGLIVLAISIWAWRRWMMPKPQPKEPAYEPLPPAAVPDQQPSILDSVVYETIQREGS